MTAVETAPGTLPELIAERARRYGAKTALIDEQSGEALSYAELETASGRIAGLLQEKGVERQDRVALLLPNAASSLLWVLGVLRRGAIPVPLDPALAPAEVDAVLSLYETKLLVTEPAVSDRALWRGNAASTHRWKAAPEDPAVIFLTSGTTGGPKGIAITHAALLARWARTRDALGLDDTFTFRCLLPLAHATFYPCLAALYCGGTLVLSRPFDLKALPGFWSSIARHGIDTMHLIPPIVKILIRARERFGALDLSSLRFLTCTSAALEPETVREFETLYGLRLLNCYGLKETGFVALTSPDISRRVLESAGQALSQDVAVIGEEGRPLPAGEVGEIAVRVDPAAPGFQYFRRPDLNALCFRDGWYRTGDLGAIDAHRRLYLRGRISDTIKHAGRTVAPEEVDAALRGHPAVLEAATLGVLAGDAGEDVVSFVVTREEARVSETELISHCRRRLAAYKCPVRIRKVEAIPRSALGKIRRQELLRRLADPPQ